MTDGRPHLHLTFGVVAEAQQAAERSRAEHAFKASKPIFRIGRSPSNATRRDGGILALMPSLKATLMALDGRLGPTAFIERLSTRIDRDAELLAPGQLQAAEVELCAETSSWTWDRCAWRCLGPVPSGAVVVCDCPALHAHDTHKLTCHLEIAAGALRRAGWSVAFDEHPHALHPSELEEAQ